MPQRKRKQDELPQEEKQRRERQRELRRVALDLRAKGVEYNPRKHGNRKSSTKKKSSKEDATDKPHKPRRPPTVIIIPIYWQHNDGEKDAVIAAARLCMQRISENGIKVDLDTTNTHTPGAKFRYWEERGVKLRVELGPEDVANGTAVLAICGTPGEVAEKHTLAAPDAVAARVCALVGAATWQGNGPAAIVQRQKSKDGVVVQHSGVEKKQDVQQLPGVLRQQAKQPTAECAVPEQHNEQHAAARSMPGSDDAEEEDDFGFDLLAEQGSRAKEAKVKGRGQYSGKAAKKRR